METNKGKGLDNTPAYRKSSKNIGHGVAPRPASYTNRNAKGSGVSNTSAYVRKGGELAK